MGDDQKRWCLLEQSCEYPHPSSFNIGDRHNFISIVYYLSMSFTCLVCVYVCLRNCLRNCPSLIYCLDPNMKYNVTYTIHREDL
jgi:hypothetical protein